LTELTLLPTVAESINSSSDDALEYLLKATNSSLTESSNFREMFTSEQVEALVPPLADYISMSAAPITVNDTLLNNRSEVRQLLANLRKQCHGHSMLQSQVSDTVLCTLHSAYVLQDYRAHRTNRDRGSVSAGSECIARLFAFFPVFIANAEPVIISFEYGILSREFVEAEPTFDYNGSTST
jgi:hypothetical protein